MEAVRLARPRCPMRSGVFVRAQRVLRVAVFPCAVV